MVTGDLR